MVYTRLTVAIVTIGLIVLSLFSIKCDFEETSLMPETIIKTQIIEDGLRSDVHNQISFIYENLWTFNGNQYAVVIDSLGHIIAAKRSLPSSPWATQDTGKVTYLPDSHHMASLGIDPDGYIHIIFHCHYTDITSNIRYIKSTNAEDISSRIDQSSGMTGSNENRVTYPTFFTDGSSLYCFYRNGHPNTTASWYLNKYNHGTTSWSAVQHPLLSAGDGRGPYLEGVAVDGNGYFHIFWCYRELLEKSWTNKRISYAKSEDKGSSWKKSNGSLYGLPITYSAAEVVDDVGENDGILNQNEVTVDSDNVPHIAYYKVDGSDCLNFYHAWLHSGNWTINQITSFTHETGTENLPYEGFLFPPPLSRPDILAFGTDIIVLFTHPTVAGRLYAARAPSPYISWEFHRLGHETWGTGVEVNFDKHYWASDRKLHLLLSAPDLEEGSVPVYCVETDPNNWTYPYAFEDMYS